MPKTSIRVGPTFKTKKMKNLSKKALIALILSNRVVGGSTHCDTGGHCKVTL